MPSMLNIGPEIKYKGSQCNDSPIPLSTFLHFRSVFGVPRATIPYSTLLENLTYGAIA